MKSNDISYIFSKVSDKNLDNDTKSVLGARDFKDRVFNIFTSLIGCTKKSIDDIADVFVDMGIASSFQEGKEIVYGLDGKSIVYSRIYNDTLNFKKIEGDRYKIFLTTENTGPR